MTHSPTPPPGGDAAGSPWPALILLFGGFGVLLIILLGSNVRPPQTVPPTAVALVLEGEQAVICDDTPTPQPTAAPGGEVAVAAAQAIMYTPEDIEAGHNLFLTSCSACHGQNAQGIQGLGKNLIMSDFMTGISDADLVQFIIVGRMPGDPLNTTGMPMPARGGNPMMTDAQIGQIVAYLRSERAALDLAVPGGNVQSAPVPRPEIVDIQPFVLPGPVAAAAAFAPADLRPAVYTVAEIYGLSCAGCHGLDGRGVPGLADTPLRDSELWGNGPALIALLTADPTFDGTGAFVHPSQATLHPPLTDADLTALIGYLYSLP